ncbi:MAG: hypothetical protein ACHQ50_15565, partial [Fimbriimonadales bacterium]
LEERLASAVASADGVQIPPPAFDEARFQASFDALSASLAQWKTEAEASQKALEERLASAAAGADGLSIPAPAFDEARFQASFDSLSSSLAQWKLEAEASQKALEERLASAESTPAPTPTFSEARLQGTIEALAESLDQWKSESAASQRAFESRIADELANIGSRQNAEPVDERSSNGKKPSADADGGAGKGIERSGGEKHSKNELPAFELESIDGSAFQPEAAEEEKPGLHVESGTSPDDSLDDNADEVPSQTGWPVYGGSQARRWSASLDRPIMVVGSEKHLTALTPIVTPATEHRLGPVLYMGKKVLYGHGPSLKGMWPGRGESSAALQEEMPNEPWRIATLDGHAFCVEEDQVEIVNLAAWHVVARFSGVYVDHITTKTHWVGLASAMGQLSLDYRNLQGRQLGEPVKLPFPPQQIRGLVADGERVFVAAKDGNIFGVELGNVKELASADKGDVELLSISVSKSGLVVVVRAKDGDVVRLYGFDGKLHKHLSLGFKQGFDHPVLMGDRIYLVDAENRKVMACNLKKQEVSEAVALPGDDISAFCGVFHADQHALLISVAEKEHAAGKVLAVDANTGAIRVICEVNERKVQILAADARVVVGSSTFYQNMIRVFDPFNAEAQKAA